jgi:hypothetical protein
MNCLRHPGLARQGRQAQAQVSRGFSPANQENVHALAVAVTCISPLIFFVQRRKLLLR